MLDISDVALQRCVEGSEDLPDGLNLTIAGIKEEGMLSIEGFGDMAATFYRQHSRPRNCGRFCGWKASRLPSVRWIWRSQGRTRPS